MMISMMSFEPQAMNLVGDRWGGPDFKLAEAMNVDERHKQ